MELTSFGPLCALASSVTWAIGTAGYSKLTKIYSPYSINFLRALIALPLFFLLSLFVAGGFQNLFTQYQSIQPSNLTWFLVSLISSHGLGDVLFLLSTRYIGISAALAISSCCPIWNTMAGYFFARQPVVFSQGLGLCITLFGLTTVILSESIRNSSLQKAVPTDDTRSSALKGILLAIGTSFLWALNAFASIQGATHLPLGVGNSIQMLMSLISTLLLGCLFSPKETLLVPFFEVKKTIQFFVIEAFIGNFLYLYGISHSTYTQGLTLASLAPAMAIPIGFLMGIEKLCVIKSSGIITIIIGTILILLK